MLPTVGNPGNIGRDSLLGPGLFNFDAAVLKNTKIGERIDTQFRAEFFNILNHPNFGILTAGTFVQGGAVSATAGTITTTTTFQRQIQFGLEDPVLILKLFVRRRRKIYDAKLDSAGIGAGGVRADSRCA